MPTDRTTHPSSREQDMTAAHDAVALGRISYIGAGPGDPGLLTVRAAETLATADLIMVDPDVSEPIVASLAEERVQRAVGDPGEVAATVIGAAREGKQVVRLIVGDVLTADQVITEVDAVAEGGVPFEIIPGLDPATAAATYAGIAVGSAHTVADVRHLTAGSGPVGSGPVGSGPAGTAVPAGTLLLHVAADDLAHTAARIAEGGIDPMTPVAVTAAPTLSTQRTVDTTVGGLASAAADLSGPLVVVIGRGVARRHELSWWESRALYGWRVLVPRTRQRDTGMLDRIRAHGGVPQVVRTMSVEPPRSPTQMERAVKGLVDGRYEWVVFTSVTAVRAMWEKFAEFGLDSRALSGVRIACADTPSADAVAGHGITPDLVSQRPELSTGLLDVFPDYDDVFDPVDGVLLPRADIATETLSEGLRERGWQIDDVTAYRTVRAAPPPAPIREAIKTGGFDAVCFTSASTVRNLVGIAGKPHSRTIVACLGPRTAETAREYGLRVDVLPDEPDVALMIEALALHAHRLRIEGALPPPRRASRRK